MPDGRLTKQLIVSAPVSRKCAAGVQKCRWNDIEANDFKQCNLSESWRELVQERALWCSTVKLSVRSQAEELEKSHKDERKRRREQRLLVSARELLCSHPGCSFQAINKAGLTNHQRQHHSASIAISHSTNRGSAITNAQTRSLSPIGLHLLHFRGFRSSSSKRMDGWCVCVCVCVCVSVCLSALILALCATRRPTSNLNGFSVTLA